MDGTTNSMAMSLSKLQEMVKDREAQCAPSCRVTKSRTRLSNFTFTFIDWIHAVGLMVVVVHLLSLV